MRKTFLFQAVAVAMFAAFLSTTIHAQGLLNVLKKVESDPNKTYALTEMEGPCLIFVTSFSTRQEAHSLVLEFRKSYKWHAYVYEKTFVHEADKDLKGIHNLQTGMPYPRTKPKYASADSETEVAVVRTKPKYLTPGNKTEFAVVVGNFPSMDDKQFKKTLEDVRKCQPSSLKSQAPGTTYSLAFGLVNPLLPSANQQGFVDPFVESINKDSPYTLLRNPCCYTVQIATFMGRAVVKPEEIKAIKEGKKNFFNKETPDIETAGQTAVKLCRVLRSQGIEAYEFHDRYSSIVTVGSFDYHAQQMPDGRLNVNPQILQVVQRFQGQVTPGATGVPYNPVIISGIPCDIYPKVIEVPRARRW